VKKQKAELFLRRCDEILYYCWDPIGVCCFPGTRDEYKSYVTRVFEYAQRDDAEDALERYLIKLERDSMGLVPDPERARRIAELIVEHRDWIGTHAF